MELLIIASARKHGIADDDILHAFNHPISYEDLDDRFVMIIGPTRSVQLIEVGFIDTDHGPVIVHAMTARRKYFEVMAMPRSLQEVLEHADELERRFAEHDPTDVRDAAPLHAVRDAVTERAATERRVAGAVAAAREAGVSWSAIGGMLGTSGEAARKRYGGNPARPLDHVTLKERDPSQQTRTARETSSMAGKKNVHTVPTDDGWANKREGATRASSTHATKAEAQAAGRAAAKKDGVEHLIHKKDGTIGDRNSYGDDPYPPKG